MTKKKQEQHEINLFEELNQFSIKTYGAAEPPPPYKTPTDIRHLDALLGGGLWSSQPVMFTSSPESGKSTFAYQFAKSFQEYHKNPIIFYIDIEGTGREGDLESREQTFNIDSSSFGYKPFQFNIVEICEFMKTMIDKKNELDEKNGTESHALFIWDSIAATPSTKDLNESDPSKVIGYKARELSQNMTSLKMKLMFNKVTLLLIDQVRANIKIDGPYVRKDQSVGDFGNFKSATNTIQLHHSIQQWVYMSKHDKLKPSDNLGIDGWVLRMHVEKNKFAPSQLSVDLLFDKKFGVKKIESEYFFMNNYTYCEKKLLGKDQFMPLNVVKDGHSKRLLVHDVKTGNVFKESEKFKEADLVKKYNSDKDFKAFFDEALEQAIEYRIRRVLFRNAPKDIDIDEKVTEQSESLEKVESLEEDIYNN